MSHDHNSLTPCRTRLIHTFFLHFSLLLLPSKEHPRTSTPTPRGLVSHHIKLIALLDEFLLVRLQRRDRLRLFDVGSRDEFPLFQTARVFEELVLEGVVDVFLDDDEFFVALGEGVLVRVRESRSEVMANEAKETTKLSKLPPKEFDAQNGTP